MTGAQAVLADPFAGGGGVVGVLVLTAFVAVVVGHQRFRTTGVRQREVTTQLSPAELAAIFEQKVCGIDWSIVERGNPMVAQSGPIAGVRAQIAVQWTDIGSYRVADLAAAVPEEALRRRQGVHAAPAGAQLPRRGAAPRRHGRRPLLIGGPAGHAEVRVTTASGPVGVFLCDDRRR